MARPKKDEAVVTETKSDLKYDLSKIDAALAKTKKEIGESSVISIGELKDYKRIASRSPTIGYVFGGGGTANPIIIELYGPESAGKTLVAENILADFQREGHFVGFVDAEYSFNAKYAEIQGLDTSPEKFALVQPDSGEDAFTAIINLASTGQVRCIAIDSVAALVPQAELNGEMENMQMGALARLMGKGLRKAWAIAAKNNCTLIFLNQIRMKIGVIMGNPETQPGGQALRFMAHIRCEVRKGDKDEGEDGEDMVGIKARIKNVKNKTSVPFRKGEIFISFKDGIDVYGEYVDFGVSFGIIQKGGAWYTIGTDRFQGRANIIKGLKENETLFNSIKEKVDAQLKGNPIQDVELPETISVEDNSIESLASQALGN